jgi:DNA-binding phage protein
MARSRPVETMDYMAAARRFTAAAGRRCAEGDEPELVALVELHAEVDKAVAVAVAGWLANGRTLADVARALGISRQAAHKRFNARVRPVDDAA